MLKRFALGRVVIVTATGLEASAIRRALPHVSVYEAGVGLAMLPAGALAGADIVISCGLAGGLSAAHSTGTVVIPANVRRPDGTMLRCDEAAVGALTRAAQDLGYAVVADALLTADTIVRGDERTAWAKAGFVAVDMETGLLRAPAIAAVRVILDTPQHELSADWLSPTRAFLNPRNWPEALWLARTAPRCARVAAAVVAAACS